MSIVTKICEALASKLEKKVVYRRDGKPYLERYYILHSGRDTWIPGIYLHKFLSSDEDPELHDHPWGTSVSLILDGGYVEEQRVGINSNEVEFNRFSSGQLNIVRSHDFHRIELVKNPTWTLFVSGNKQDSWGFWNQQTGQYLPWKEHIERKRYATN